MLCISGNPYGVFVTLQTVVRPLVAHMSRRQDIVRHRVRALSAGVYEKPSPMRRFVRAHFDGKAVRPADGSNDNGVLSTLHGCNCLMEIPAGSSAIKEGDEVWVHPL